MSKNSSIYITPENEAKIMAMYDAKLAGWPVPYECFTVPTRFGRTHIIASGPKDAPPIVLIHAMGVTSTMWLPNIAALSSDHRVYAPDTIGDLGKSVLHQLSRYPKNGQAYSEWLVDVFNELGIEQACVVGASMGGWITMNHAIYAPNRVKRIVLLGPQGIASNLEVLFRLFSIIFFPTQTNKKSLIRWILGDNPLVNEAFADYMVSAMNCRGKLAPPLKLPNDKLRRIKAPTLLFVGESDPTLSKKKDVNRAARLIHDIQVEIMHNTGHIMSTEDPDYVNTHILKFL